MCVCVYASGRKDVSTIHLFSIKPLLQLFLLLPLLLLPQKLPSPFTFPSYHCCKSSLVSSHPLRMMLTPFTICTTSPSPSPASSATLPGITQWTNVDESFSVSRESLLDGVLVRESECEGGSVGVSKRCRGRREGRECMNSKGRGGEGRRGGGRGSVRRRK